ncbi:MAG: hypothetical protein LAT67_08545 [Balneolales bacterium]|nr:hypothetical protein [Balneolales bacterium]
MNKKSNKELITLNLSPILLFILMALSALIAFGCDNKEENPEALRPLELTLEEQAAVIESIIRYAGRMPAAATINTRYAPEFDEEYRLRAAEHTLDFIFADTVKGKTYLLISRDARSLHARRIATGIEVSYNEYNEIESYKEHFRTWAMAAPELDEKGFKLFKLMKNGADLSPYYPENSGSEEYIEFPNSSVIFNTKSRSWERIDAHPLLPYYELRDRL